MKDYQFAYGKGSVTVPLDERSVRAVLHGNEAPAMQDIRAGLVESLENPIGAKPLREEIPAGARVALVVSDMSPVLDAAGSGHSASGGVSAYGVRRFV